MVILGVILSSFVTLGRIRCGGFALFRSEVGHERMGPSDGRVPHGVWFARPLRRRVRALHTCASMQRGLSLTGVDVALPREPSMPAGAHV